MIIKHAERTKCLSSSDIRQASTSIRLYQQVPNFGRRYGGGSGRGEPTSGGVACDTKVA